ncbi:DNA cytosine methyltransferase [Consotaella aegiceratis]|uniref:DNA cytosine methyltransferase n=1 Tax=Consotaella aegiceratis TaxID=3097961 RepID=UPI002F42D7A4
MARRAAAEAKSGSKSGAPSVDSVQRALDVRLQKLSRSTVEKRRRATKAAFDFAEECAALAREMPKKELIAFLQHECELPRSRALTFLKVADLLGAHRDVFEERAVGDDLVLRLAREPEPVRLEAISMLRAGRDLSDIDLRALRQDVMAGEEVASGDRTTSAVIELRRAVRVRAEEHIQAFQRDLLALTNDFAALYNETSPDDRSQETQQRVEALAAKAALLLRKLTALVPTKFLVTPSTPGEHDWPTVKAVLGDLAEKRLCLEEDWSWPETHPLWIETSFHDVLVWAQGQELRQPMDRRVACSQAGTVVPLDGLPRTKQYRPSHPYQFSVLELCAGAGGQALGLHAAGFRHVGLVEFDRHAAATLRHNEPGWPVIETDVTKLDFSPFRGVDVLAAGLPCQPYSSAGERRGAADARDLFERALEIIAEVRPRVVMIENVIAILHVTHAERRRVVLAALKGLGYDIEWRIVRGRDFGMAQNRQRAILVAMERGSFHRFRWPTIVDIPKQTVGEALYDLMAARGWKGAEEWAKHACGHAPTIIGGSKGKQGLDLGQPGAREAWRKLGVDPNYIDPLAPSRNFEGNPRLTLPMLARLQDFPDDWEFRGPREEQLHQIANAFPPRMARKMGLAIERALSGEEIDIATAVAAPLVPKVDVAWLNRSGG